MITYLVFDWLLKDSQEGILDRARYSGGTLVEVVTRVEVERVRKEAWVKGMEDAATIVKERGVGCRRPETLAGVIVEEARKG